MWTGLFGHEIMVVDTKSFHTRLELRIIKGYLFRGDLQITVLDHSPLHEWGTGTESSSQKRESEARERAQALQLHL